MFHCEYGKLNYAFHRNCDVDGTLVLLHGLGASHAQFSSLISATKSTASVLAIDMPGHGENIMVDSDQVSFDSFCHLILCLCDDVGITSAVFAGISMGSALALACAAHQADLVRQLVVVRPSWLVSAAPDHLSLIDRCGQWLSEGSVAAALTQLEADPAYGAMRDDVPLAAASVRGLFERDHAKAHAPVLSRMFHSSPFKSLADLRSINVPATVVGTHVDSLHPMAVANAVTNALPNAELQILPPRYLQPENHQAALNDLILKKLGVAA